ncbi:PREDICTED: chymotrypsinogen 2-like, partial [Ficedula albicollis]|uniref:chymotrypsinogen 2-like n=1 Tax=Ficedula albicollis TaxID=59894 RepID=UPI0003595934
KTDTVVVGAYDQDAPGPDQQKLTIEKVFKNPKFNMLTIHDDITLIKLATPAQLSDRVSPVCLPKATDEFDGGLTCVTTGWGLTNPSGMCTFLSPSLFPSPASSKSPSPSLSAVFPVPFLIHMVSPRPHLNRNAHANLPPRCP